MVEAASNQEQERQSVLAEREQLQELIEGRARENESLVERIEGLKRELAECGQQIDTFQGSVRELESIRAELGAAREAAAVVSDQAQTENAASTSESSASTRSQTGVMPPSMPSAHG